MAHFSKQAVLSAENSYHTIIEKGDPGCVFWSFGINTDKQDYCLSWCAFRLETAKSNP